MKHLILILLLIVCIYSQKRKSFQDVSSETEKISRVYFQHYLDLEFDKMGEYLTKESTWADDTAKDVWGSGQLITGKDSIVHKLKDGYKTIQHMSIRHVRDMFTGTYAIFEVIIDYTSQRPGGIKKSFSLPAIFMFRVQNGKVILHRDFADYSYWVKQNKKYRRKK